MKPLRHYCFIIPITTEQQSNSGLIIQNTDLRKAKVMFAGPGTPAIPATVKSGDVVLYTDGHGAKWNHEGVDGLMIEEHQLISIL